MGISEKQKKILAFSYTDYKALICDGAVRSGKTSIMTVAFVDWAMREFNNCTFVLAGKTVKSCQRNLVTPFMSLYETKRKYNVRFKITDNVMIVENATTRNYFYIFGGKDESSYALIQGITASGILLDEVALMPRSFVEQAVARTLSVPTAKLWFNCNPEDPNHWFYSEWILKSEEKKAKHLHFLMTDNPVLTAESLENAERLYSGVFHDRYIKGLWKRAEGLVFRQLADNPERWLIVQSKLKGKHFVSIEAGFDIGGNKSAYAFTVTALGYDGIWYVLYSKIVQAQDLDMDGVEKIVRDGVQYVEETYKQEVEYINTDHVDVIINHLRRNTVYTARKTYKPPLEERPLMFNQLLNLEKIKFVKEITEDLVSQLKELIYNDKAEKAIVLDDGTMQIDDWDSLVYSVARHWKTLIDKE